MISLISEISDAKGRRAPSGWVAYDAGCPFCLRLARRLATFLEPRGFGFIPLQDPRIAAHLNLPEAELLREMRVLAADGRVFGGGDAVVFLAGKIWWAWPLAALARLPGILPLLRRGYRWFAARRQCNSGACPARPGRFSAFATERRP